MRLKEIRFKNYKAFKKEQKLIIKPVTILIGKNSSGKSAVARLPLLIGRSMSNSSNSPIELQFDSLEFGGSFKDLVHNRIDHGNISFTLIFEDEGNQLELGVTVQNIADSPLQFISNYYIKSNEFNLSLKILIEDYSDSRTSIQNYDVKGNLNGNFKVKFKGLLIDGIFDEKEFLATPILKLVALNKKIKEVFADFDYIGPFRTQPERDYIFKGSIPKTTGYGGELAPHILGIDSYLNRDLIEIVGDWYKENLGGWQLEIENVGTKFQIVLVSPDNPNVKINLRDVGHGMSQVLPLIVRSAIGETDMEGLMIIEQPELHLHPAAHGGLAELIVTAIMEEGSNWIIETHSELFILRIRRLIAEGKIAPSDVIIYLIEDEERPGSTLKEITIDENGEVSDWPKGVFSEDYEEMVAIRKAQKIK